MGTAVGYVRIPSDKSPDHSAGLDDQTEQITLWCKENGHRLDDIHMDAHGRKGLMRMVDTMPEGAVLVVQSLAVLGGTADEMTNLFERLYNAGANLVLIQEGIDTSSAPGQVTTRLLEAFFRLGSSGKTGMAPEVSSEPPPQATPFYGMGSPTYMGPSDDKEAEDLPAPDRNQHKVVLPTYVDSEDDRDQSAGSQDDAPEEAQSSASEDEQIPGLELVADADSPHIGYSPDVPRDDRRETEDKADREETPANETIDLATPVGGYADAGTTLDAAGSHSNFSQNGPSLRGMRGVNASRRRRKSDYINVAEAANRCVHNGEHLKAIALWRDYLDATDDDNAGVALNAIGDVYVKMNRPIEAIDYLFRASRAFEEAGFYPKAVAALKKVLKLNPRQSEVHLQLATLAARCDRLGDAVESYLNFAHHLMESGLKIEAINIFEKIRILDPVNARHRLQLAEELLEFGFTDEAVEETCFAADMLIDQGNAEDAERHLARLLNVAPGRTDILERIDLAKEAQKTPVSEPAQKMAGEDELVFVADTDLERDSDSFWIRPLESDSD